MNSTLIEAIGYLGSTLVLVSFLMVSVVRLRIVNTIGSVIFTVYAFIIHSYPTAIMNLCLVMINIYYLLKMRNTANDTKHYELVKVAPDDGMLKYTLEREKNDIQKFFPGINIDLSKVNAAYMVCFNGAPAGIFLGTLTDGNCDIILDYSLPAFRDSSVGNFLTSQLPSEGINTLTYSGPDEFHKEYLSKNGFAKHGSSYVKTL